jgi:hypothetical protein
MNVWTDEWDQERASQRSIEEMLRIAQDAEKFAEDEGAAYEAYAKQNKLTVNEIVYYLNAYEAGGVDGLQAIRNPDIIPPDTARNAIKTIERTLAKHFESGPPLRITDEGTAIGLYEIQQRSNGEKYLFEICQFRLTVEKHLWHLYWIRKFDAWWPYPAPEHGAYRFGLAAGLRQVIEDPDGCFWG